MEIWLILSLIAFGAAAVIAAIEKGWALALVAVGLFFLTLPRVI